MKLRLAPNSVRLRLNGAEVAKLAESGELAERIVFPGVGSPALVYSLRFGGDAGTSTVRFENGEIAVCVPADQAMDWANRPQDVGMYFNHQVAGDKVLRVIIEKDFK